MDEHLVRDPAAMDAALVCYKRSTRTAKFAHAWDIRLIVSSVWWTVIKTRFCVCSFTEDSHCQYRAPQKEMWTALLWSLVTVWLSRFLWRRWKYDLHKIPCPPGLPILGHTLSLTRGEGLRDCARWVGNALKRLDYPKLMRVSNSRTRVAFKENGFSWTSWARRNSS